MSDGPVEAFLAELAHHLRGDEETRRRVTAEVGDHLRDLVAEGRARGLDEHAAETEAVERFGSPRALARGLRPARRLGGPVRILSGVAVAGGCVALALTFAGMRSPAPHVAVPVAGGVGQAGKLVPLWCLAAIRATDGDHDSQMLVQVNPRTGAILTWGKLRYTPGAVCHPVTPAVRIGGVWYATSDPSAPFG